MADHDPVLRQHGYHPLRVTRVVREAEDASSFVLDVPHDVAHLFHYAPGQFCTFHVHIDGEEYVRSYSMSSAPETDDDLTVTVKRVPGGLVSNWLLDHVRAGDVVEAAKPAGVFCPQTGTAPVVAFCGGSGITPVMSITKSVLATTPRRVRLLYANRGPGAVIFDETLHALRAHHLERLEVRRHFDTDGGFLSTGDVVGFVGGDADADFYICGPSPFMDLVKGALIDIGVGPEHIFIERFVVDEPGAQTAPPPRRPRRTARRTARRPHRRRQAIEVTVIFGAPSASSCATNRATACSRRPVRRATPPPRSGGRIRRHLHGVPQGGHGGHAGEQRPHP